MKLFNKVAIAGAVGVAVAVVANYCWNWWKKGDKGKEISIVPASKAIPLMPESVSLKEENVKVNPMIMPHPETLKEGVKEIPLAPRFIIHRNEKKPQRGIYCFEVDEIGPVDALIDTGATVCVVRRNVLPDSIMSKIIKSLTGVTAIKLFDGISKLDILGYVFLSVSYLDQKVKLPFYVVAELCEPMILGNNWIRKSQAILQSDGTKLAVTFGGKKKKTEALDTDFSCPSPCVSVDVDDDLKGLTALVDSGSKKSFIRSDILTEFQKASAIPTSDRSTMANNAELKGVLKNISLNITVQGTITFIENVHIASKLNHELVLGMDWIDKTHAVIQSDGSKIIVSLPDSQRQNNFPKSSVV